MKNKLQDLNDHLFAQLERLGDEDLAGDELKGEINRAKAIAATAREIVATQSLAIEAEKLFSGAERLGRRVKDVTPAGKMLGYGEDQS